MVGSENSEPSDTLSRSCWRISACCLSSHLLFHFLYSVCQTLVNSFVFITTEFMYSQETKTRKNNIHWKSSFKAIRYQQDYLRRIFLRCCLHWPLLHFTLSCTFFTKYHILDDFALCTSAVTFRKLRLRLFELVLGSRLFWKLFFSSSSVRQKTSLRWNS